MFSKKIFLLIIFLSEVAYAHTIYPIDRANILAGSKFDLKVEFSQALKQDKVKILINGKDPAKTFGKSGEWIANEDGQGSTMIWRNVSLHNSSIFQVVAKSQESTSTVSWEVFKTGPKQVKNVILFIGDGMTIANRTAARVLSRGISEGKYHGKLSFDDMPHMALIGTSGSDSLITDSANSMSAYTTGHIEINEHGK